MLPLIIQQLIGFFVWQLKIKDVNREYRGFYHFFILHKRYLTSFSKSAYNSPIRRFKAPPPSRYQHRFGYDGVRYIPLPRRYVYSSGMGYVNGFRHSTLTHPREYWEEVTWQEKREYWVNRIGADFRYYNRCGVSFVEKKRVPYDYARDISNTMVVFPITTLIMIPLICLVEGKSLTEAIPISMRMVGIECLVMVPTCRVIHDYLSSWLASRLHFRKLAISISLWGNLFHIARLSSREMYFGERRLNSFHKSKYCSPMLWSVQPICIQDW